MAARGSPPDPTAEEKLSHPIIQSAPRLQKTIRHPGKAHLPRLYWTPPLRRHRCIEDPHTRAGPERMHQPMLPAAHQPGPKPPRPSRSPNPEAERPQNPKPPRTNPGTVRPPGWQPTSAATGIPSSATCSRQKNSTQESPLTQTGQGRSPSAEPPKKPTPREPQMPQAHIATPRQQQ